MREPKTDVVGLSIGPLLIRDADGKVRRCETIKEVARVPLVHSAASLGGEMAARGSKRGSKSADGRPAGERYRNLYRRGTRIYYVRSIGGKLQTRSTKTNDWNEAAAWRDRFEKTAGAPASSPRSSNPAAVDQVLAELQGKRDELAAELRRVDALIRDLRKVCGSRSSASV